MKKLELLKQDFKDGKILPTDWLGDSLERFEIYSHYASKCKTVTEFGVYTGSSTIAFLLGKPNKMRSYDITDRFFKLRPQIEQICKEENIDYKFSLGNSLKIKIEETDFLFIDTKHEYEHALAELNRHSPMVQKYIALHDTGNWPGVFKAVAKFLELNRDWFICYHCNKNSGLTILERY